MSRFLLRSGVSTLVLLFSVAAAAEPEIYRWTNADGSISFSDRIHRVPREARSAVQVRPRQELAYLARATEVGSSIHTGRNGRVVVPFQRTGSLIEVSIRLNEEVTAPFYVDTAASSIVIPSSLAASLALGEGPERKHTYADTANGRVLVPVARLASVDLQGALVEDVDCMISDHLEVGLLGASYLRHFRYTVDAASQTLVLEPLSR
jgi:clan AA aspartic protease (TIGR02281 family)